MDNLPIPPEQNLEQPVVPPPPKINPMFIIGGLILIAIILTGGIFIGRYLNTSQNIPAQEITPIPTVTPMVIPSVIPSETPAPTPTVTPIPDSTANWKTYTSKEYGFSFKYPPTTNYTYPGGIRESQIDNHTQVDLYTFDDDLVLPVITVKQDQCRSDSILVEDGQQLLKLMIGIKNLIVKTKNGHCLSIFRDIYEPLDMLKRSNDILDQILSTFKFLN